jgi:hypothetical protein
MARTLNPKPFWLGCQIQVHKATVVVSSQYQLKSYSFTHKHLAHPHMSLVRYTDVGALPYLQVLLTNAISCNQGLHAKFLRSNPVLQALRPPQCAGLHPKHRWVYMDSQHTCARCWRVKPITIGMLPDVARGLAGVSHSASHVVSSQYQLTSYFFHSQIICPYPHEPSSLCGRRCHTFKCRQPAQPSTVRVSHARCF